MKTPIKSLLLMATGVALFGLTAHAQYTGAYLPGVPLVAGSVANATLRDTQIGSGASVFGENLYLNSTLGVTNIFTGWMNGPVNVAGQFAAGGGQVRLIYLGKTAGWQNDLGYVTIPPYPHSAYYEVATNIDGTTPAPGHEAIISYGAGQKLDFFINTGGPVGEGGLFYGLGLGNEFAGSDSSIHVHWNSALLPTADYGPLWTYFIGFEDERNNQIYYDQDFNDLMIAIQFLPGETAVPEPSTYGMIGAAALLGLAGYRRFKNKAAAKAAAPA